jgi:putative ABC transport system permease protein
VILKALGATRRRILLAHAAEYGLLAGATATLAVGAGTLTAWIAVTQVMAIPFAFSLAAVAEALAIATGLIFLLGGVGTAMVLSARPVPILRAE